MKPTNQAMHSATKSGVFRSQASRRSWGLAVVRRLIAIYKSRLSCSLMLQPLWLVCKEVVRRFRDLLGGMVTRYWISLVPSSSDRSVSRCVRIGLSHWA